MYTYAHPQSSTRIHNEWEENTRQLSWRKYFPDATAEALPEISYSFQRNWIFPSIFLFWWKGVFTVLIIKILYNYFYFEIDTDPVNERKGHNLFNHQGFIHPQISMVLLKAVHKTLNKIASPVFPIFKDILKAI